MLITARQIRMARAALEWSQKDLAERCDIAITSIARIESEIVDMRSSTANKIEKVFCENGMGFTRSGNVESVIFKGE